MKKSVLLSVIGVLLVVGVGITFAYFTSGVEVSGNGSTVELNPGDMIKVSYNAGDNSLSSNNLIPGETLTKTFRVTITPTSKENTASYSIYLDLTNNTFVKCDDSNYNSITNACIKDYEELTYEFKDSNGEVVSSGNLIGLTGRTLLIAETKTVDKETTYEYTMEITFHETNADQNHNMDKVINGSIEVEFGMVGSEYILASANAPTSHTTDWTGEESYYYTGNPNNWVSFAGFWWRIIRINGDGSIRMIYQGVADSDTPDSGNITGDGTQIGTSVFNSSNDNNMYVGYMYGSNGGDYDTTHSNINSSNAKITLDVWYGNNLVSYSEYIDGNAGFCGDRYPSTSTSSSNGLGGTGTTGTYYGAYIRLFNKGISNSNPSLQCDNQDIYTTTDSRSGNKSLQYPLGLIAADEASLTGITWKNSNKGSYLYTGKYYWTISPFWCTSGGAGVFIVHGDGTLIYDWTYNAYGVRPVINLKSDVSLTGSGTINDPFAVVGAS